VTVVLSSWACESGHWNSGDCVTHPGATFTQPITVNVYQATAGSLPVTPPTAGTLIATMTQTFTLPYRPSSDASKCPADYAGNSRWFSEKDKTCYHGLAVPISFNFAASSGFQLTPDIVVTFAYNTTTAGPTPLGTQACSSSSGGCPYDSLNISTDGAGGQIGTVLDPNGIFVNYILPNNACSPVTVVTGTLADDTGCWAGYHPEIQVVTKH